ncbi:hypothetical protein AMJ40_05590 [candidate division TA06 bacterium DG_26]|uniref:LIM zinc-binding domain-containing protein n=1 Tax=candidate division TA06 bacterium DG_26 TaxID=1703771 RepID=A0A0S7WGX6_UNCT6|nr:MAG: hypothetical protein AMJ40_05590 [candidate division TA06 bacterium DG_26]
MRYWVCEVCKKVISEYHIKLEGKYYHYYPCFVEKLKNRPRKEDDLVYSEVLDDSSEQSDEGEYTELFTYAFQGSMSERE